MYFQQTCKNKCSELYPDRLNGSYKFTFRDEKIKIKKCRPCHFSLPLEHPDEFCKCCGKKLRKRPRGKPGKQYFDDSKRY